MAYDRGQEGRQSRAEELTQAAVERWVSRYRDKILSVTDAVSFEAMEREGVREAFAFDEDFERVGFAVL